MQKEIKEKEHALQWNNYFIKKNDAELEVLEKVGSRGREIKERSWIYWRAEKLG